jgi:copper chaperone CopZ
MKTKILMTTVILFLSMLSSAQNQSNLKTDTLGVEGVCGMCKARIEKAAKQNEGVVAAAWSEEKQLLTVVYDVTKVSLAQIQKSISEAGHNTTGLDRNQESYEALPYCCKFRGVHKDDSED